MAKGVREAVEESESPAPLDVETIGEKLPLLEGLRTARAIRRLRPDPVPRALIRKVCEAGTFAPSGGNRQPWVFVAVDDAEKRRWIAERYRPIFQDYIREPLARAKRDGFPERLRRNMEAALHLAEHLHEAPVLLFVAAGSAAASRSSRRSIPARRTCCSPAAPSASALRSRRSTVPSAKNATACSGCRPRSRPPS